MNWHECKKVLKKSEDEEDQDSDEDNELVFELNDLDRVPFHVVKIDQKNDKIKDLEQNVANILQIPLEKVNIFLRNEPKRQFDTLRIEYLNMDWMRQKKLESMLTNNKDKFAHGTVLFVENNDQKTPFDKFDWYRAMMNYQDLYKLHINLTELQPDKKEVTIVVQVPKTATL